MVRSSMSWRTWPSGLGGPARPGVAGADVAAGGGAGGGGVRPRARAPRACWRCSVSLLAPLWLGLGRLRRPLVLGLALASVGGHGDRRHAARVHRSAAAPPEPALPPRRRQRRRAVDRRRRRAGCRTRCRRPRSSVPRGPRSRGTPTSRPSFVAPAGSPRPSSRRRWSRSKRTGEPPPAEGRRVTVRVRSARGARVMAMFVPEAAGAAQRWPMNGTVLPPYPEHRRKYVAGGEVYGIVAPPPEGVVVTLELDNPAPVEAVVWDLSEGLPAAGDALRAARPAWAVPSHGGDRNHGVAPDLAVTTRAQFRPHRRRCAASARGSSRLGPASPLRRGRVPARGPRPAAGAGSNGARGCATAGLRRRAHPRREAARIVALRTSGGDAPRHLLW